MAGIGQIWLAKLGSVTWLAKLGSVIPVPVGFPEEKRPNFPWKNTTGVIGDGDNEKAGKRLFVLTVLLCALHLTRERDRETETGRQRQTDRDRKTDRQAEADRQKDRQTDRQKNKIKVVGGGSTCYCVSVLIYYFKSET